MGRVRVQTILPAVLSLTLLDRHEFEWKREACYLIRKPDPAVMVAITKEPTGKIQTTSVQILDYNLNRYVGNSPC